MTVRIVFTADPIVSAGFVQAVDTALDVDSTSVDGNTTTLTVHFTAPGVDVQDVLLKAWIDSVVAFPMEHMKLDATGLAYEDLAIEHTSEACERCGWRIKYEHGELLVVVEEYDGPPVRTLLIRCTNPACQERFGRSASA